MTRSTGVYITILGITTVVAGSIVALSVWDRSGDVDARIGVIIGFASPIVVALIGLASRDRDRSSSDPAITELSAKVEALMTAQTRRRPWWGAW